MKDTSQRARGRSIVVGALLAISADRGRRRRQGGAWRRPTLRESTGRRRRWRRSSRERQGGEGAALVVTTANGGEGRARPSRERVREMRGRVREDERVTWGSAWHPWTSPGHRQKQEVAGVWPRAPATRSSSFWREEDDDWQGQSAGPSQVGWASTCKAQVGFPLSLFF